jgi:hypothetical protein
MSLQENSHLVNPAKASPVDLAILRWTTSIRPLQNVSEQRVNLAGLCFVFSLFLQGHEESTFPWTRKPSYDISKCEACIDKLMQSFGGTDSITEAQKSFGSWVLDMALPYAYRTRDSKMFRSGLSGCGSIGSSISSVVQCLHLVGRTTESKELLLTAIDKIPYPHPLTKRFFNPLSKKNQKRIEQYRWATAQLATAAILIGDEGATVKALKKWKEWNIGEGIETYSISVPGQAYRSYQDIPFDKEKRSRFKLLFKAVTGDEPSWIDAIKSNQEISIEEIGATSKLVWESMGEQKQRFATHIAENHSAHAKHFGLDFVLKIISEATDQIKESARLEAEEEKQSISEAEDMLKEALGKYIQHRRSTSGYGARRWESLPPEQLAGNLVDIAVKLLDTQLPSNIDVEKILGYLPTIKDTEVVW